MSVIWNAMMLMGEHKIPKPNQTLANIIRLATDIRRSHKIVTSRISDQCVVV